MGNSLNLVKWSKDVVEERINNNGNLEEGDVIYQTALIWSADRGFHELVQKLITYGVQINAMDESGHTALSIAAYRGHEQIVSDLIKAGASYNVRTLNGDTPLAWATIGNHYNIVKLLIQHRVSLDAKNIQGYTALMWAAYYNQEELVQILTDGIYPDPFPKNKTKQTAMALSRSPWIKSYLLNYQTKYKQYITIMTIIRWYQKNHKKNHDIGCQLAKMSDSQIRFVLSFL